MEEREDQIGTMAQPCKSPIGLLLNLPSVLRGRIQEMSLHVAMTSLLGIQVRGIGRQLLHHDLGVLTAIDFHLGRAMGLQAIPDHHQRAGEVSLEMPQEDNDVGSVDRMIEVPLVDTPRQCQGDRSRYLTPFADPSQDRGPPRGSPCGSRPAAERETRLIDEDDGRMLPPGFFAGSAANPVQARPGSLPHLALWRERQGSGGSNPKP
jgi:hypothetical protein